MPELWLFLMGGLFIGVVMYFPNGVAGLWESHGKQWFAKLIGKRELKPIVSIADLKKKPEVELSAVEVSK